MSASGAATSQLSVYLRALSDARAWWSHIGFVFILGLLWTPVALALPVPIKIVIDHAVGEEEKPAWLSSLEAALPFQSDQALWTAVLLTMILAIVSVALGTSEWLMREHLAECLVRKKRQKMMRRAFAVAASHSGGGSDSSYRIIHDAPAVQWVTIYGLPPFLASVFALLAILFVVFQMSSAVALIAMATSVPVVVLIRQSQRRICTGWHRVKELDCAALDGAEEAVGAWRLVRAFSQEESVTRKFGERLGASHAARMKVLWLQAGLGGAMSIATAIGTGGILVASVLEVRGGHLTPGGLVLITAYIGQLYAPVHKIATHMTDQQAAIASMQRSYALLDAPPALVEREAATRLDRATGSICIDNVSFQYGDGRPVLTSCNINIPAGSWVGITGPSGAGKTTLINLVMRFLDPSDGRITLDGQDLRDLDLGDLRRQFALLGQEAALLSGTVAENVAFGTNASRDDVVAAARKALAHDFIERLPQGYDTPVGAQGASLSGGQRQRIALARVYLRGASILVLDEPTSALDATTEVAVLRELRTHAAGRTLILISHRDTALAQMDQVIEVGCEQIHYRRRRTVA